MLILQPRLAWTGSPVFGPEPFQREAGPPVIVQRTFAVADPAGPFWLWVFNGSSTQTPGAPPGVVEPFGQVSSARIWLNGEEVVEARDLNEEVFKVGRDAILLVSNLLEVELTGIPGSFLTVEILRTDPNVAVDNPDADLSGENMGNYIHLAWALEEKASEYVVYRALSLSGPWEELGRLPRNRPNAVDFTAEARLRDLCYRVEALDAQGKVIHRYEPICVPKFIEKQSLEGSGPGGPNAFSAAASLANAQSVNAAAGTLASPDPPKPYNTMRKMWGQTVQIEMGSNAARWLPVSALS